MYKRRNEVERTINQLKSFRAVATRFDKRAYTFHGTVTVATVRLWLRYHLAVTASATPLGTRGGW
jgi:transposase